MVQRGRPRLTRRGFHIINTAFYKQLARMTYFIIIQITYFQNAFINNIRANSVTNSPNITHNHVIKSGLKRAYIHYVFYFLCSVSQMPLGKVGLYLCRVSSGYIAAARAYQNIGTFEFFNHFIQIAALTYNRIKVILLCLFYHFQHFLMCGDRTGQCRIAHPCKFMSANPHNI